MTYVLGMATNREIARDSITVYRPMAGPDDLYQYIREYEIWRQY